MKPTTKAGFWIKCLLTLALLLGSVWVPASVDAQEARDCDDNAVIRCGALSVPELKQRYNENDRNTQRIFSAFGINNTSQFDGMVMGSVSGSGQVYVGDQLVATDAQTAGRQYIEGGLNTPIADGLAYRRSPSVSFVNPAGSLPALVKLNNGRYQFAVITSCGNPVAASPVVPQTPPPTPPTPTPPPPTPPPAPLRTDFTIDKSVRLDGQQTWSDGVTTQPGKQIEYRIRIRNTGDAELADVKVWDHLPAGLSYVEGSLEVDAVQHDATQYFANGLVIGDMSSAKTVEIRYTVLIASNADACGDKRIINTAHAKPANQIEKSDTASVEACQPQIQTTTITRTLPDTGPATVATVFIGVTIVGAGVHFYLSRRRLS